MRVISIDLAGLARERCRNLHGEPPKRINLPPLTGKPEKLDVLARLLPLAVICKHSYSPDQIHQLRGPDGGALFPFEHAVPGNFTFMWCYKTRKGPPRTWRSVCF